MSELRGSSARATQAIAEYQGSDQGATTIHANVSAQVAARTVGTSGESRLYRYQASSSISGGQMMPNALVTVASAPLPRKCCTATWTSRHSVGEMTMVEALRSGSSADKP